MFTVSINDEMVQKLRAMLEEEDEGVCVRLREYKAGGGCHAKIILGLGMDEMDEDEDEQIVIKEIPFVAEKDFLLKYGTDFALDFSDKKEVVLTALHSPTDN